MLVHQCFFITEKQQKKILNFSLGLLGQNNVNNGTTKNKFIE